MGRSQELGKTIKNRLRNFKNVTIFMFLVFLLLFIFNIEVTYILKILACLSCAEASILNRSKMLRFHRGNKKKKKQLTRLCLGGSF